MKLKYFLCLLPALGFGLQNNVYALPSFSNDSTAVSYRRVKIGPEELGRLVDPAVLAREKLDERLKQVKAEQALSDQASQQQQIELLLTELDTYPGAELGPAAGVDQAIRLAEENRDFKTRGLILGGYGEYYARKGDFKKSLQFFKTSLEDKERTNDKKAVAATTGIIALISKASGNYDDAVAYYEYNIRASSALQRANDIADAYRHIAEVKGLQEKYQDAEYYILRKAFPLYRRMGNKVGRMDCFEALGNVYHLQNRLSEAKWFYLQAQMMAVKLENFPAQASYLAKIGRVKNQIGETESALQDYKSAATLARNNNYISKLIEIKGAMGELYTKAGKYLQAQNELDEYTRLKKSIPVAAASSL